MAPLTFWLMNNLLPVATRPDVALSFNDLALREALQAEPLLDATLQATCRMREELVRAALAVQVLQDIAFGMHLLVLSTRAAAAHSSCDRACLAVFAREAQALAIDSAKAATAARSQIEMMLEQTDLVVAFVGDSGKELDLLQARLLELTTALRRLSDAPKDAGA